VKVVPRCKQDWQQLYVDSDGTVYPCSWIANHPHTRAYKDHHGENLADLNAATRPLKDIVTDPQFLTIEKSWDSSEPFFPCLKFCGKTQNNTAVKPQGQDQVIVLNLKTNKLSKY